MDGVRVLWCGGVGMGGVVTFMSACTLRNATLRMLLLAPAHVLDTTLQMHLLALAHVSDAALQMFLLALAPHVLDSFLRRLRLSPLQLPSLLRMSSRS